MDAESHHSTGVLTSDDWRGYACEARRDYKRSAAFRERVEEAMRDYLEDRVYDAVTESTLCGE
jgi:hypothetical protein